MDTRERTGDEKAIRALIGAHFQGLKWTPASQADWAKFAADFLPDASLFPAAGTLSAAHCAATIARRSRRRGMAKSMKALTFCGTSLS